MLTDEGDNADPEPEPEPECEPTECQLQTGTMFLLTGFFRQLPKKKLNLMS